MLSGLNLVQINDTIYATNQDPGQKGLAFWLGMRLRMLPNHLPSSLLEESLLSSKVLESLTCWAEGQTSI